MANLRGFPPSNTISPSVRIVEKDLSFILPEASFNRAGLVGFASKGPLNTPILVQSRRQLERTFGQPHPEQSDPYLIYAAQQYLLVANELFIVRVGDEDPVSDEAAQTANIQVPASGTQIVFRSALVPFPASVTVAYGPDPVSNPEPGFFRWKLNGIIASKVLSLMPGDYTLTDIIDTLNDQLDPEVDGIMFRENSGTLEVVTTFAFGVDAELELMSVQNALYGGTDFTTGNNILGLATGSTAAISNGTRSKYPDTTYGTDGVYDFSGLSADNFNLQIVVDGTDNVLTDNVVQIVDLGPLAGLTVSISDIVTFVNNQVDSGTVPGGFEAFIVGGPAGSNLGIRTKHKGRDARLLIKSDSTALDIFGFDALTKQGTSLQGTTGDAAVPTFAIINGAEAATDESTFELLADSPGIDGNDTQVRITNDVREGTFVMEVFVDGSQVEAWGNLSKNPQSTFYVETFLATTSDYIRVLDNESILSTPRNGVYQLSGGTDGIPADPDEQDDLLIGSPANFSGMFALSEPEQIDIDLLAAPGHSSTNVILAMIDLVENFRGDAFAIIDPPFGLTVNEIIQWQNGVHPLNTVRFDTDFAALYWPWLRIRDVFNQIDVWIPPSGSVMAVYAQSDQPWLAPAGLNRGLVPNITDVFSRPTLEERDSMYGNRNAINPIISFSDVEGFVVFGQKTLQRRPTALDRVNVRRMLFYVEKRIRSESRRLLFDPNDDIFREQFINLASDILTEVRDGRGLTDFIIQADEELNTPDVIDRNEFRARIGVQPARAVEFMFIEFTINRTGDFSQTTEFG